MIMYKSNAVDGIHFGNKSRSIGWGDVSYLYEGGFHDGRGRLTMKFDKRYLWKHILADHSLVNWGDNIDSLF